MIWYGTAKNGNIVSYTIKDVLLHADDGKDYELLFKPEINFEDRWLDGITQLTVIGTIVTEWHHHEVINVDQIHPTTRND